MKSKFIQLTVWVICLILVCASFVSCGWDDTAKDESLSESESSTYDIQNSEFVSEHSEGLSEECVSEEISIDFSSEESSEDPQIKSYHSYDDFSQGLAWIKYSYSDGTFWGCIDKSGKLVFQFPADGIVEVVPFSEGYAYIKYDNSLKIIDKNGTITSSFSIDESNNVVAFGDGYALTENYKADFDSKVYTYNICDANGNVLKTFSRVEKESWISFVNFGKGVFGFGHALETKFTYFPQAKKWIEVNRYSSYEHPYFEGEKTVLPLEYGGGYDDDGYRGKFKVIDLNGNIQEVIIPEDYGWNWSQHPMNKDGICVLSWFDDYLISYNSNNNSFKIMDDKYFEKIMLDLLPEKLVFSNGYIALPLKGSDGYGYVGVFDTEWNIVFDPIKMDEPVNYWGVGLTIGEYSLSDNRLITKTDEGTKVYDMSGNIVFTPSKMGYSGITSYVDGVARVENKSFPTYLDQQGNVLFAEIDISAVMN